MGSSNRRRLSRVAATDGATATAVADGAGAFVVVVEPVGLTIFFAPVVAVVDAVVGRFAPAPIDELDAEGARD